MLGTLMITNNTSFTLTNGVNVTGGPAALTFTGRTDFVSGGRVDIASGTILNLAGTANAAPVSSATLTKNGDGTLLIGGGNTYWDLAAVVFNAGTTSVRNANALGDNGPVIPMTLGTNATFVFGLDGALANKGGVNINGDSSIILDRATVGTAQAQNNGTLLFNTNYTLNVYSGPNVTNGTNTLSFNATSLGGDATFNIVNSTNGVVTSVSLTGNIAQVSGTNRALVKNGSGMLTLRPPSPAGYSGGTIVNGGILQLSYSSGGINNGTLFGQLTINTGAIVRSTVDKGFGFANIATAGVQTVYINGGMLEQAGPNGHGAGQTIYMTAGEIRSNNGQPSPSAACYRIGASGTDPTIYVLASSATSLFSGRIAMDVQGKFDVQDGTADIDLLITAAMTDGIAAGNPPNGYIKTNAGTMAVTASNIYSGVTRVDGGRLLVNNGTGSGTGTNNVLVGVGATLGGTGTIAGIVISDGTVAPGASPGTLTMLSNYTQNAGGTLSIELAGTNAAAYDRLSGGGVAALNGTLSVTLTNAFAPAASDAFTILTAASVGGTFATTNLPVLGAGLGWTVQYLASSVILSVTGAPPPLATGYDLAAQAITNPALRGYQDDADGDGYANLLEYVTGGSLTNPGTEARMNGARTNGLLALKFTRNLSSTDATLVVEGAYSPTNNSEWIGFATNILGSWGSATNVVEDGGSPANVTAYDVVPAATNRYLRLRVTRP